LFTQKDTFQEALAEAGLEFNEKDRFSPSLTDSLMFSNQFHITRAEQVCVLTNEIEFCGLSAGETVSEALADLDVTPQNIDYAQHIEYQPIPPDRKIILHQVEERLVLQTDQTSFSYAYQE